MTPRQYAKREILAGRFAQMNVEKSPFLDCWWIVDRDFKSLDGAGFASREAAEKARSKAVEYGCKFIGVAA